MMYAKLFEARDFELHFDSPIIIRDKHRISLSAQ